MRLILTIFAAVFGIAFLSGVATFFVLQSLDEVSKAEVVELFADKNLVGSQEIELLAHVGTAESRANRGSTFVDEDKAHAIAERGKNFVPGYIKILRSEKDPTLLSLTASTLSYVGYDAREAVPELMKTLEHENSEVSESSAYALSAMGDALFPYREQFVAMIRSDSETRIKHALLILDGYFSDDSEVTRSIGPLLKHKSDEIRVLASDSIRWRALPEDEEFTAMLVAALNDGSYAVVQNIAAIIGTLGDPAKAAIPRLIELTRWNDELVQEYALRSLSYFTPTDEIRDVFEAALNHSTSSLRTTGAEGLWRIEHKRELALQSVLKDVEHSEPGARYSALRVLAIMAETEPVARDAVEALKSDEESWVAGAANRFMLDLEEREECAQGSCDNNTE